METVDDYPLIEKALNWFLGFMSPREWNARKQLIEASVDSYVQSSLKKQVRHYNSFAGLIQSDEIGFYLYLMEMMLNSDLRSEPMLTARIAPAFVRIGAEIDNLKSIGDVNKKVRNLIRTEKAKGESGIFEILTALLWMRNGWDVRFLPEIKTVKQPDLNASRSGESWNIECKRMSSKSGYVTKEQEHWERMLSHVAPFLLQKGVVVDINFHVEMISLPESFLLSELIPSIDRVKSFGILFNDDRWTVIVRRVDYRSILLHMNFWSVRDGSTQIMQLINGHAIDWNRGFSYGLDATIERRGSGKGFNMVVDSIKQAYAVTWQSDAVESVVNRARDIHRYLVEATAQVPAGENAVLHVGIETYNGPNMEKVRLQKILDTVGTFDLKGKSLQWIHCHFFQSYSPPDAPWIMDESHYYFGNHNNSLQQPLKDRSLIIPKFDDSDSLHWFKEQP